MLASLLLFRIIYYLVPFVLALALLGAREVFRHWQNLHDVVRGGEEEKGDAEG
jgi:uncharacterized membrane protein YbhN (UPF0104 family)